MYYLYPCHTSKQTAEDDVTTQRHGALQWPVNNVLSKSTYTHRPVSLMWVVRNYYTVTEFTMMLDLSVVLTKHDVGTVLLYYGEKYQQQ